MLIVNHHILNGLQRDVDDVVDIVEAFISQRAALRLFEVKFKILQCPLAAVIIIVVRVLLGNSHLSQMNEHIVALLKVVVVFLNAKAGKSKTVEVDAQGAVVSD
jgi:hypothetical protein